MGRMGALNNGQSSWAKIGMISAFGTSYGEYAARADRIFATAGQWDNMVAYETPDFAGFKVYAQYAMGSNDENESTSDRFYSIGATYNNGPFAGYFAVDSINYATAGTAGTPTADDSLTVTLGGSYDFEVVKVYLGAQYFDEVKLSNFGGAFNAWDTLDANWKFKGYGVSLSADAPVAGGKVMFGVGYVDAESSDWANDYGFSGNMDVDFNRYVVSVGYDYPFSKRTDVYAVATYMQDQSDWNPTDGGASTSWDPSAYSVVIGLRHKF